LISKISHSFHKFYPRPLMFQYVRIARLSGLFHGPVLKMSLFHPKINNMELLSSLKEAY